MDHKVFPNQRLRTAAWSNVSEQNKPLSGLLGWCDAHTHQAMWHKQCFIFVLPGSLSLNLKKNFPLPQEALEDYTLSSVFNTKSRFEY